jgi:hypothetical protein
MEKEYKNEYYLTPLESIVINKLMPKGFKLDEESVLLNTKEKSLSPIIEIKNLRTKDKKHYSLINNNNNIQNINNKNISFKNGNNHNNNSFHIKNNIQNKLLSIINSIKEIIPENKNFSLFNNDLLSFEKDILNNKYKSPDKFYSNFEKNFIQKYSSKDDNLMNNLKLKISVQIDDLNKKNNNNNQIDENNKNKTFNMKEKAELANLIRSISEKQLEGIIYLLEKKDLIKKEGYYELDLENMDNTKLNEIDIYVRRCRRSPSYEIPNSYKIQFKKKITSC